jgi:methylenetetrahydrofolate--tRNA-(uracil-5-)-methyltransferase
MAAAERKGQVLALPPPTTAHGALINHITGGHIETTDARGSSFQPMNINFGLFPPVDAPSRPDDRRLNHAERAVARKHAYTSRALADFRAWLGPAQSIAAE